MHSKIASITENYGIAVLPFAIIANRTRRVLGWHCIILLWGLLHLEKYNETWTRSNAN